MAVLILLNGPPASGKSTLARELVETQPLALNLDIDVVRGQLGRWLDDPIEAGLSARRLVLVMTAEHLAAGHSVVVPQFLGRVDFIEQLEAVAAHAQVPFVEIMLDVDRQIAIQAFDERTQAPQHQTHLDAAALVERSDSSDPVGERFEATRRVRELRPNTMVVPKREETSQAPPRCYSRRCTTLAAGRANSAAPSGLDRGAR